MRHIDLNIILASVLSDADGIKVKRALFRAHKKLVPMDARQRHKYIRDNGPRKWKLPKDRLVAALGSKCWYTEVEVIGGPLTIDHFRPVCNYWWLAFDVQNYRVACPFANSPKHNALYGCAGGKGDDFPLMPPEVRASGKKKLRIEKPVILDPCDKADCELLAFQTDGRPVLNPVFDNDPVAQQRVEQSKLLLNLDHPDFNSKREQLCQTIATEVQACDALAAGMAERNAMEAQIKDRIAPTAPFSTAARYYLSLHRHLDWVERLLNSV